MEVNSLPNANDMDMSNDSSRQMMTINQWHQETVNGFFVPLHIPIYGVSMFPLVRYLRDYVTIVPYKERPVVGDVVLFHDSPRDRYVLHRIIQIDGEIVTTRGDNCLAPDPPIHIDDVWGNVVLIERGKLKIRPNPKEGLRHAKCWYQVGKVYRFIANLWRSFNRHIKSLLY